MIYFAQTIAQTPTTNQKIRVRSLRHKTSVSSEVRARGVFHKSIVSETPSAKLRNPIVGEVEIWTAEDLYNVRDNISGKYIQMADIDISSYSNWTPIGDTWAGKFTGDYDGNGYKIQNLTISNPTIYEYVGLFGNAYSGKITNVFLQNVNIDFAVASAVGALIGYAWLNTIEKCKSTGIVTAINGSYETGGLIGYAESSLIKQCTSACTVTTGGAYNRYTGGLLGYNDSTRLENSYYIGTVTGDNWVGGMTGESYGSGAQYIICYSAAVIECPIATDAVVGNPRNYVAQAFYWDSEIAQQASVFSGDRTTTQMKTQSNYSALWDFSTVWGISPDRNNGYPYLLWEPNEVASIIRINL